MQHEYFIRGRRIQIEQLDDLIAVKPTSRNLSEERISTLFGNLVRLQELVPATSGWRAFARAGWAFVRPNATVLQALGSGSVPEGATLIQRVFVDANGRLVLGLDRLTVRLSRPLPDSEARAILDANGLAVVRTLRFANNSFHVRVTSPTRHFLVDAVALSSNPEFIYAEPEFMEHMPGRFEPTDPDFGEQWHLANTGQDPMDGGGPGSPGADIGAEAAWNISRGAGVRVALVDNGFDLKHPDLPAVTANSGYFTYDAIQGNASFTQGTANYPPGDHGTLCAGMVVALANNDVSGCGVAHQSSFTALACASDEVDTQVTLARAIAQAADPSNEIPGANPKTGADVISCSLGSGPSQPWMMSSVLQDAIDFAVNQGRGGLGTPVFWATNDDPVPISQDEVCSYPHTIAVGMSNRSDQSGNSAYGPELDFLAPGEGVFSTSIWAAGLEPVNGTSFAAPLAAGVAALVLSTYPYLTGQQVRQIMRDSCKKIGSGYDATGRSDVYGYGRINAAAAVQYAKALKAPSPPTGLAATAG